HVHSLVVVLNENLYELMDEDATQEDCFRAADDVLHNACAGIAEIINVEGNVNVDFEDVKTIMGEQGQAMMGTAVASGADRARIAAEQAIACPLLEGVDLHGARGVLVNITASRSLKMRETREIMDTIGSYASADATVIFGTAYDEAMGENLRVTGVATGLGAASRPQLVSNNAEAQRTGTDNMPAGVGHDFSGTDVPSVIRKPRSNATAQVRALETAGMDHFDIPTFLLKQADCPGRLRLITSLRGCRIAVRGAWRVFPCPLGKARLRLGRPPLTGPCRTQPSWKTRILITIRGFRSCKACFAGPLHR